MNHTRCNSHIYRKYLVFTRASIFEKKGVYKKGTLFHIQRRFFILFESCHSKLNKLDRKGESNLLNSINSTVSCWLKITQTEKGRKRNIKNSKNVDCFEKL